MAGSLASASPGCCCRRRRGWPDRLRRCADEASRHLRAVADLAISTGIDPERGVIAEDGVVVDLVGAQTADHPHRHRRLSRGTVR